MVIDFNGPVSIGNGVVVDFVVPRDLIGAAGCEAD